MAARRARRPVSGWRGPAFPGDFPSLGDIAADWIERWCVIPDGPNMGQPFLLTEEQYRFLLYHYRLKLDCEYDWRYPSAPFYYRRSLLVRPQKWGKGPLTAAIILFEAIGPALFAGWDEDGEPTGIPWATPWIQVAASSEDQTDNIWRALLPMIQLGPLADIITDAGQTRIKIPGVGDGYIEPVTSSGRARLGQRLSFSAQDEPHSWLESNGGWRLADTQRRNLAGMGGRSIGTTNAWDPAEQSDAQRTYEVAEQVGDIYVDYPTPPPGSLRNKRERRKVLKAVYGDSWWIDLDRIEADVIELIEKGELAQAERFFANRVVALGSAFYDIDVWLKTVAKKITLPKGSRVAIGFDGSQHDDWTVLRGRLVRDDGTVHGFQPRFDDGTPMYWNPLAHGGDVPVGEVEAAFDYLFDYFQVLRFYADTPFWQSQIDALQAKHPELVFPWETYRTRQMAAALERQRTDVAKAAAIKVIAQRSFSHDGEKTFLEHLRNARAVRRPGGVIIGKPSPHQKIDLDVADALAHEAAMDAITAGEHRPKKRSRAAGGF